MVKIKQIEQKQHTALGYLRISDKKQIKGESKANQKAAIQNYADTNGIKIIQWFYDEAKSGKNAERDELQSMIRLAMKMKGQINYVLVYKMSRASRDVETYITQIRSVLAARGIKIRSVTEPFDDSPMGKFVETLYVSVAQLDNDTKREMVVDNMTRIAKQGFWQHKPPRGYERCSIKNDEGKPRPSMRKNHDAEKIEKVLMRINRGDINVAELVRYATSNEFYGENGKPFTQQTITNIVKCPEYAGFVHDKFTDYELVPGKHEAIISEQVYWENQEILKRKSKTYLLGLKHHTKNKNAPLSRFILCVSCKEIMTRSNPGGEYRYYCARKTCRGTGSILADDAHRKFEGLLAQITPTKGTLKLMKEVLVRTTVKQLGGINEDLSHQRARLDEIAITRTNTVKDYVNRKIDSEEKQMLTDSLDAEKLEILSQVNELEARQTLNESHIEYALNFMENVAQQWADSPLELKQKFQKLIFPKGFIYDIENDKFIINEISPLYRGNTTIKQADDAENSTVVTSPGIEPGLQG